MSESPTPVYEFDPRKLPQGIRAAIGFATACAAQTESIVEMAISGCLGIDEEYGAATVTHMTAPLRDNVLRAVAEIRLDDLDALDELDELLDTIKAAQAKRNDIVHHGYCKDGTGKVYRVEQTARASVNMSLIPLTASGIEEDGIFIYEAGMALLDFLINRSLLPPEIPQGRSRFHKLKAARKKRRKELLRASG